VGSCGPNSSGSGYGPVADSCEHGSEHSGSIKCGEFLKYMNDNVIMYSALWSYV
jgi:hypothetical protein